MFFLSHLAEKTVFSHVIFYFGFYQRVENKSLQQSASKTLLSVLLTCDYIFLQIAAKALRHVSMN